MLHAAGASRASTTGLLKVGEHRLGVGEAGCARADGVAPGRRGEARVLEPQLRGRRVEEKGRVEHALVRGVVRGVVGVRERCA